MPTVSIEYLKKKCGSCVYRISRFGALPNSDGCEKYILRSIFSFTTACIKWADKRPRMINTDCVSMFNTHMDYYCAGVFGIYGRTFNGYRFYKS